ncbi:hypothetical protein [Lentibacillus cibarius]|nr:hypothetical protein [Lentibacillus cibarius]
MANKETEIFFMRIIEDRLEILSKNHKLVQMLLSESLKGSLPKEINLPEIIFMSLKKGIEYHFKLKNQSVDTDFCARQLGGIFLSYVVLPNEQPFNKLTTQEKKETVRRYAKLVLAAMEEN